MTIISTIIICVSYFLLLYAIVAFMQDKKWMGTVAKEVLAVIPDINERFRGAHVILISSHVIILKLIDIAPKNTKGNLARNNEPNMPICLHNWLFGDCCDIER